MTNVEDQILLSNLKREDRMQNIQETQTSDSEERDNDRLNDLSDSRKFFKLNKNSYPHSINLNLD